MHLKPTAGCQISTLIFEKKVSIISNEKNIKDGKVLAHFGIKLKILLGSLTEVSA
jgi:hypothetical protein